MLYHSSESATLNTYTNAGTTANTDPTTPNLTLTINIKLNPTKP